jgi:hypothetical protein
MRIHAILILAFLGIIPLHANIIHVPADAPSIQEAVQGANTFDTILLAPGIYQENIALEKALCIASHYILTGDQSFIFKTIIDGQATTVFGIFGPSNDFTSIIGLTIRNGEDGIMAKAPFHLDYCFITGCEDGIDYESGSAGTCLNSVFQGNLDDGIDLDGSLGTLLIQGNIIAGNDNDGIEIRLHPHQGDTALCMISNNWIFNNGEDGIQFIDYPDTSHRVYVLERNLIYDNAMAGIGLMDNGETDEDYRGAAIPEPIFLFNNTIANHPYALSGGANLYAINTLFVNAGIAGIRRMTGSSRLSHCLFHGNAKDLEEVDIAGTSLYYEDPLLDIKLAPQEGSPCIDHGTAIFLVDSDTILHLSREEFTGDAPDLGAVEFSSFQTAIPPEKGSNLHVYQNPCRDYLIISGIQGNSPSQVDIRLLDARGREMELITEDGDMLILDTSQLSPGVYFLHPVNETDKSCCIIRI